MDWIVKIENKPDHRIKVIFDAINEIVHFYGQYKPQNKEWIVFSEEICSMNTNLETIQDKLLKSYELMKKRLDAYKNIAEGFSIIKTIEIQEEEIK